MPFILFENHCSGATISSETTIANFGFANATDGRTNTQVGITGDATGKAIELDFGESKTFDTLGIARHNFATASDGADTVVIEGKVNSGDAYSLVDTVTLPASNDIFTSTFTQVTYRYLKLTFTFTNASGYMADISIGERLDLERSQKFGFIKPEFADSDTVIANITRGQNLVGLNIEQAPKRCRFSLFYYTASFYSRWADLVSNLKQRPCYIVWNDSEKPFYCWPTKAIPEPKYSNNIIGYYDATLDMSGITQ